MPQNKPRVIIPRNLEELLKLAQLIQEKDAELGNQSPLAFLDWKSKLNAINEAMAAQKEAEALRREMERAYERRDALLQDITTWVRQSRDMVTYSSHQIKDYDAGFSTSQ